MSDNRFFGLRGLRVGLGVVALAVLAACSTPIPDSGAGVGAGAAAEYPVNSPEYFTQSIGDRVYFDVDQAALTPQARAVLDAQAQWLADNPAFTATIEGHADERGTREYNLALGARRAEAVRSYLVSRGVAESRLKTVSYGKERPEALCSAESCWSQNRRAVTVLSGSGNI